MSQQSQPAILLDRSAALERIGGDEELLREIAGLFLLEYPQLLDEIREAVEAGDASALERSAHSLKGAVANFAAPAAVNAALDLESMGRSRDLQHAMNAFAALEEVFLALHPVLVDLGDG